MIVFTLAVATLVAGYLFYGRFVEAAIRPDPARTTPALARADGVDFVAMPGWRVWLVQLLNIAGLGPVFGPIMGAVWGPQVFLWIVFGCILGGAVHDLLAGFMSLRNDGAGLPDLIGRYLGQAARHLATAFILVLMVLVGTVFVKGPALLIVQLLPAEMVGGWFGPGATAWLTTPMAGHPAWLWVVMGTIFAYYVVATLLPIDAVIGRVYPFLALALLVMVAGLLVSIFTGTLHPPAFTLANLHPGKVPAWPIIFITVSCGAVSGFHGTQSPLMARCLKNERLARPVFYGAMIAEGLIALIWAASAHGFYGSSEALAAALQVGGPGQVVHEVCVSTMGAIGGCLAVVGVVVLPITSGDTAFRVGRLILADYFRLPQQKVANRYLLALPLFAVSISLNFIDFTLIWRYFGWANQTLAAVTLWAGAVYLAKRRSRWWLAALPATFMTVMTFTYILVEKAGFGLPMELGTGLGLLLGIAVLAAFLLARSSLPPEPETSSLEAAPSDVERQAENLPF